jgi:hypothetical protein
MHYFLSHKEVYLLDQEPILKSEIDYGLVLKEIP